MAINDPSMVPLNNLWNAGMIVQSMRNNSADAKVEQAKVRVYASFYLFANIF